MNIERYKFVEGWEPHMSQSNDGEYVLLNDIIKLENIKDILLTLSEEERLELFNQFCGYCGYEKCESKCQCWNDE